MERAKLFRRSSASHDHSSEVADGHNGVVDSTLRHLIFDNQGDDKTLGVNVAADNQDDEAYVTRAQQIPSFHWGPFLNVSKIKIPYHTRDIYYSVTSFDYEMFSFFYFVTGVFGIIIIITEFSLNFKIVNLMNHVKAYESKSEEIFVNTFSFQKDMETQYYLYAFFVLFLCFCINRQKRLFI